MAMHLVGSRQLLVGPASSFAMGADEGALFDAGDIVRMGVAPVAMGPFLRVERDEGAGTDHFGGEAVELFARTACAKMDLLGAA